ncbi:hypothetical protein ABZX51_010805 [Aspergillus tubingensis]
METLEAGLLGPLFFLSQRSPARKSLQARDRRTGGTCLRDHWRSRSGLSTVAQGLTPAARSTGEEVRERRGNDLETRIYPIYHMAVNLAAAHGDPRYSGCHLSKRGGVARIKDGRHSTGGGGEDATQDVP